MGATHFVLAFHNHQPVGNFENVFREAFEKCYDPFLRFLEDHSFLRVSLHYSGCLLDWLEGREKQFLKRLVRLVRQNQVEILSGGYYEPILPLIPERDALGQLNYMNAYLARRFGERPLGFWLTERVWEQKLPRLAAEAGLRYTAVDDTHFALAGLAASEVKDFFITEEENLPLRLFPIPKFLRYAIPFHEPEESMEYLRRLSSEGSFPAVATYADDGEKFGLWPGTYQWVYRDRWLERFAQALEQNQSWLSLKTFREVLEEQKARPLKKVYLPSASYEEMTEWSLSREKAGEFVRLKRELESAGVWDRARAFFQGGTFKNFLSKYSEADWMRSKMGWVSRRVEGMKDPTRKQRARLELWQAQCNCPYWHGVFGGLYLHHLRRSTYEHLIRAEKICFPRSQGGFPRMIEEDLNQDGVKELVLECPPFSFYFLPHRGGALGELDFHPESMNVLDVMTRREEAYHRELVRKREGEGGKGRSIHEIEKNVSSEVWERIAFDAYERTSLVDRLLPALTSLEAFWKGALQPLGKNPTQISYFSKWEKGKNGEGLLTLQGKIPSEHGRNVLTVEKEIRVVSGKSQFTLTWRFSNGSKEKIECRGGSEWNFNFFDRERSEEGVKGVEIQDGWSPVHLEIRGEEPFDYWQFPIETVAQTEKDFRLMHQGISVFPHWRISLEPGGSFERTLTFSFSSRR